MIANASNERLLCPHHSNCIHLNIENERGAFHPPFLPALAFPVSLGCNQVWKPHVERKSKRLSLADRTICLSSFSREFIWWSRKPYFRPSLSTDCSMVRGLKTVQNHVVVLNIPRCLVAAGTGNGREIKLKSTWLLPLALTTNFPEHSLAFKCVGDHVCSGETVHPDCTHTLACTPTLKTCEQDRWSVARDAKSVC